LKGLVFNLLERVVVRNHGEAAWDDLLDATGLPGAYTSLGSYPDEEIGRLVDAGAKALGLEPAEVLRWFGRRLEAANPGAAPKDAKTELQEYLQARRRPLPVYRTLAEDGPPHDRRFRIECLIEGYPPVIAESNSRRGGEQDAARSVLQGLRSGELP
jgi:hypothetical protein